MTPLTRAAGGRGVAELRVTDTIHSGGRWKVESIEQKLDPDIVVTGHVALVGGDRVRGLRIDNETV